MTVRYYLSSDVGAPVLTGAIGSGIAVLKGCLVTGYGSRAAAGWTEEFTGTNISVLRPSLGNRHYFRIEDTFGDAISIKGYATMSAVSTGTDTFPASTSFFFMKKSITADATPRGWFVVADGKTVWFVTQYNTNTSWTGAQMCSFGEFNKFNPTWPALNSYIIASNSNAASDVPFQVQISPGAPMVGHATSSTINGYNANYIGSRRKYGANYSRIEGTVGSRMSGHIAATPSLSTGGLLTSPLVMSSAAADVVNAGENYTLLGTLRGIREFLHDRPLSNMDTINGSGDLAGKQFLVINGGTNAQALFEISDTWE